MNKRMKQLIEKYPKAKSIQEVYYHETGIWPDFIINRDKFAKWIEQQGLTVVFDKRHKWMPLYVK